LSADSLPSQISQAIARGDLRVAVKGEVDGPHEFVQHLPHEGRVTAHDGGGCRDVTVSVEVPPVEDETGRGLDQFRCRASPSLFRSTAVFGPAYASSGI
jgi:hypothetical protein